MVRLRHGPEGGRIPAYPSRYYGRNGIVRQHTGVACQRGAAENRSGRGAVSDRSSIEWTEVTWNPTTGCDRVSAGCDNCYALTLSKRLKAMGSPKYQNDGDPRTSGPGFGLTVHPQSLTVLLKWRTPRTVFVNSMSDLARTVGQDLTGAGRPTTLLLVSFPADWTTSEPSWRITRAALRA